MPTFIITMDMVRLTSSLPLYFLFSVSSSIFYNCLPAVYLEVLEFYFHLSMVFKGYFLVESLVILLGMLYKQRTLQHVSIIDKQTISMLTFHQHE